MSGQRIFILIFISTFTLLVTHSLANSETEAYPNCKKVTMTAPVFDSPPGDPGGRYDGYVFLNYGDGSTDNLAASIFHGNIVINIDNRFYVSNMTYSKYLKVKIGPKDIPAERCISKPEICYDYLVFTEHVVLTPRPNSNIADFVAQLTVTNGTGRYRNNYGGITAIGTYEHNPTAISHITTTSAEGEICQW